jgi:hypothetical protein
MWSEPTEILYYKCDGATYGSDFGLKIHLQQAAGNALAIAVEFAATWRNITFPQA